MQAETPRLETDRRHGSWFERISIRVKLTLAFALILLLFLATALVTYDNYQKVASGRTEIVRSLKIIQLVNELYALTYARVLREREAAAPSASAGDTSSFSTTPAAAPSASAGDTSSFSTTPAAAAINAGPLNLDEIDLQLNALEGLTLSDDTSLRRLRDFRAALNDWRTASVAGAPLRMQETRALQSVQALRDDIQNDQQVQLDEQERAQAAQSQWLQLVLMVMLLGGLTLGISAMLYSNRRISDPLVALSWQMREVAAGRTGSQIREQGRGDEIGTVARALEVFRQARAAADVEAGNKARLLLELRIANEELEVSATELTRSSQYKSEFMATVSHELRTPLTSIRGSLGLIIGGATGVLPAQAKSLLSIAQSNSDRLLSLIDDLLDVEKIESGKITLEQAPLDPVALVESTLVATQGYAEKYKVRYVYRARPVDQTLLTGDARRLGQVLANLLSNAAKFAPESSEVGVDVTVNQGRVRIAVNDRGPGVPLEFRSRIFQKFSQADASDRREKGGTGLGLAICKAIVELHRGSIGFDSTPGDTTFWFELPLEHPSRRHARARVLVLESDADTAALLTSLLKKNNYDPNVASDLSVAQDLLANRSYNLLMLGRLPSGEDGVALLRGLRAKPEWGGLQVMVVSKSAQDARKQLDTALQELGSPGSAAPGASAGDIKSSSMTPAASKQNRPQVLHVEDDADQAALVRSRYSERVQLTTAPSVAIALALLEKQRFDLVILDLMLPDGTGYELLPVLHTRSPLTPVVIFSAHDAKPYATRQIVAVLAKTGDTGPDLADLMRAVLGAGAGA